MDNLLRARSDLHKLSESVRNGHAPPGAVVEARGALEPHRLAQHEARRRCEDRIDHEGEQLDALPRPVLGKEDQVLELVERSHGVDIQRPLEQRGTDHLPAALHNQGGPPRCTRGCGCRGGGHNVVGSGQSLGEGAERGSVGSGAAPHCNRLEQGPPVKEVQDMIKGGARPCLDLRESGEQRDLRGRVRDGQQDAGLLWEGGKHSVEKVARARLERLVDAKEGHRHSVASVRHLCLRRLRLRCRRH
mmetsp:Transcript_21117/g.62504  ORF Transcript_21117/g.62504 Transcript_21117/m.62504 type:complete len:246 (-) Transcript_21117:153-890(-)